MNAEKLEEITDLCSKLRGLQGKHDHEQDHLDELKDRISVLQDEYDIWENIQAVTLDEISEVVSEIAAWRIGE